MSRAKAINDMCKQCIYDPASGSGTWREQTGACKSVECPLFAYRPMPRPNKPPTGTQPEHLARFAAQKRAQKRVRNSDRIATEAPTLG